MFKNMIMFFMDCESAVSLLRVQTDSRTKTGKQESVFNSFCSYQWTESMYEVQSYTVNGST